MDLLDPCHRRHSSSLHNPTALADFQLPPRSHTKLGARYFTRSGTPHNRRLWIPQISVSPIASGSVLNLNYVCSKCDMNAHYDWILNHTSHIQPFQKAPGNGRPSKSCCNWPRRYDGDIETTCFGKSSLFRLTLRLNKGKLCIDESDLWLHNPVWKLGYSLRNSTLVSWTKGGYKSL